MDLSASQLLLKRVVNIRAVVTQRWKDEVQQGLQGQINEVDSQLQPPGPQVMQQIDNIQLQVNQKKSELLEQKNAVLQQLQEVQMLELNQEVIQGQIESIFQVGVGDNLVSKMNVEILLRDGIVMEVRGAL
jgi:hypothetical protein